MDIALFHGIFTHRSKSDSLREQRDEDFYKVTTCYISNSTALIGNEKVKRVLLFLQKAHLCLKFKS